MAEKPRRRNNPRISEYYVTRGQSLSHFRSQGELHLEGSCAHVFCPKCPQLLGKGAWGKTQVEDESGSTLTVKAVRFVTAIGNDPS
jgi:hypothetical protein